MLSRASSSPGSPMSLSRPSSAPVLRRSNSGTPQFLYLSYAFQDRSVVEMVRQGVEEALREAVGYSIWLDEKRLDYGSEKKELVRHTILRSKAVIICLSSSAVVSSLCYEELAWSHTSGKRVFPIWLEGPECMRVTSQTKLKALLEKFKLKLPSTSEPLLQDQIREAVDSILQFFATLRRRDTPSRNSRQINLLNAVPPVVRLWALERMKANGGVMPKEVASMLRSDPLRDSSSARSASAGPRTLYVTGRRAGAGFSRISNAVKAANPGDTIRISPGLYEEHIYLDKELRLVGDGPDEAAVVVSSQGKPALACHVTAAAVENLTLAMGAGRDGLAAVELTKGRVRISRCTIRCPHRGVAAVLCSRLAEPTIESCTIRESVGAGIIVEREVAATIENCRVEAISGDGVIMHPMSIPYVRRSIIRKCGGAGIRLHYQAGGSIEGNVIELCKGETILSEGKNAIDALVAGNELFHNDTKSIAAVKEIPRIYFTANNFYFKLENEPHRLPKPAV